MEVIVTSNLGKVYGNGVEALRDVNIHCKDARLYCLMGPNGAGKTTLLRILTTQLIPTCGNAYIMGFDVVREADRVRRHIAIVPQDVGAIGFLSVWQHVYLYLLSRGNSPAQARRSTERSLKLLGLYDVRNRYPLELSGGQRQRIIVAMVLATDAEVIFLDEPTVGLDPIVRKEVWSNLREIVKSGRTVFLTTHYMEEAEMLADYLFIINKGEIKASGSPSELKSLLKCKFKVVLKDVKDVNEFGGYGEILTIGDRVIIYPNDEQKLKELVADASIRGISLSVQPTDMDDVFMKVVGKEL